VPRVLFATTVPGMLRAFLLPLAQHFRARGWQVDAMAQDLTQAEDLALAFDRVWDAPWSRSPLRPKNALGLSAAAAVLRRERYDIVHVHSPVAAFLGRLSARLVAPETRVIYTAHGFHFHPEGSRLRNAMFLGLERLGGRWTDHLVVMNQDDYAAARHYRLVPEERLEFMPGIGIDLTAYDGAAITPQRREALRTALKLPSVGAVFLMVAEFIPRKRHCDAIEAFLRVQPANAQLVLAGEGPLLPEMRALAAQKLGSRCHFLGFRRDVAELLSISDALLLPSLQEGLPRCVMEAMAMGVPVVGSDIRGTRDLLSDGAGLLVPPRDVTALARALQSIINDPAAAEGRIARARQRIADYALPEILHRYEALYCRALVLGRV
jgi:glycosyltransferase involved in cell wall biosynthesis